MSTSGGGGGDVWKSLTPLLQCLIGEELSLELKNGAVVTGLVDAVDARDMSVLLGKASQRWTEGRRKGRHGPDMELVLIAGSRIRFVHFPDRINLDAELERAHQQRLKTAYRRNYIVDRPRKSKRPRAAGTAGTAGSDDEHVESAEVEESQVKGA